MEGEKKAKPIISADSAISWYYGNFLMSPNNALRDEEGYTDKVYELTEKLRTDLRGMKMTHQQFLDMMKERGVHAQFYRYQKPKPTDCPICRLVHSR